ncbi:MAG TPA: glycosyltransferase [bacterium]|nr:glycosyltransferase [bacterium]
MKIAFVVQRYGLEINGGAELHCRWVAEHMQKHWEVEVLTTRAFDYITWRNHYPKKDEIINGIKVKRFSVTKPRDPEKFGRIQNYILENEHKREDELKWLEEEGPLSPSLLKFIEDNQDAYDYFIFFSYRYYHSYWGIHTVPNKSILVPTAEHDPVIHLQMFKDLFRKPRAFIYNSHEEKHMINSLSQNDEIPGEIVGVGTIVPPEVHTVEVRKKFGLDSDYMIYIGRIDENKGCDMLFDYFIKFINHTEDKKDVKLVLVGSSKLEIPDHPNIQALGFLSEEDKFSLLNGARILVMPSLYESLSMVTLEAWALQRPVLANANCEVLKGQCQRSNAGLFFEDYWDFREALTLLLSDKRLCRVMGKNGKKYYEENYTWDVIEKKYLKVLEMMEMGG